MTNFTYNPTYIPCKTEGCLNKIPDSIKETMQGLCLECRLKRDFVRRETITEVLDNNYIVVRPL